MQTFQTQRRTLLGALGTCLVPSWAHGADKSPFTIGLTAEFGVQGSHSAQSIEKGILLAIDEINATGGIAGGRLLALETRDDRGVPARGVDNFKDFATRPDVVAVFCGRFSPVALEIAPLASELRLPLLNPWAAADGITRNQGGLPNYSFRLSLTDSWAIETMLDHARIGGVRHIALFAPNTAWGRSSEAALLAYAARQPGMRHDTIWYNWGDTDFSDRIAQARARGAQALLTVTNEFEGVPILKQMASLPKDQRLPIISHWGLLGGDLATTARATLQDLDFSVVHTFSFSDPQNPRARMVADRLQQRFGISAVDLRAQVGFAHAYDLTHLLALALKKAGRGDRSSLRHALEHLGTHEGLVTRYQRPFTPSRREALAPHLVRMARYDRNGHLKSVTIKK